MEEPRGGCGGVSRSALSSPPGDAMGEKENEPADIEVVAFGEPVDALPPSFFLQRSKATGAPEA